ncbi:MAG: succinate dehydrogenase hydrophobic membrane anchor protein [Acidothermaceae bacterium]
MSTTTRRGAVASDGQTQAAKQQSRRVTYLMMRLTGVLLAVLVTGHLVVTHVVTDVASTDASFIAKRWGSALWVTWDSLMLAAALAHAGAGVWAALDDYAHDPALRLRLRRGLVAGTVALFFFGAYVIAKAVYS